MQPKNPSKHRPVKIGLLRCKGKSSHVSHFLTCLNTLMTRSHTCEIKAKIFTLTCSCSAHSLFFCPLSHALPNPAQILYPTTKHKCLHFSAHCVMSFVCCTLLFLPSSPGKLLTYSQELSNVS